MAAPKKLTFDHLQELLHEFEVPVFNTIEETIIYLETYRQDEPIVIDLETTGLNWRKDAIRCVGVALDKQTGFCIPWPDQSVPKGQRRAFLKALSGFMMAHKVVGHNVSFDYRFLIHNGIEMPTIHADTMVQTYLLDTDVAEEGGNLGLDDLVEKLLPERFHGYKIANPQSAPLAPVMVYCTLDCIFTYKIFLKLAKAVDKHLGYIKDHIFKLQTTLLEIDMNGIKVDPVRVNKAQEELSKEIGEHLQKIYEDPDVQKIHKFNPDSVPHKKKLVYELKQAVMPKQFDGLKAKRKGGKVEVTQSTSAPVLQALTYKKFDRDNEDECVVNPGWEGLHHLLCWKKKSKLRGTYLKPAVESLAEDNTFYFQINLTNTKTGRLSATRGAHNMPKKKFIREMYVVREGKIFIEADYSQLEYRVLAHESQEMEVIDGVKNGIDFHTVTGGIIGNKDPKDVTKQERSDAKNVNFAVVYGAGVQKLCQMIGKSVKATEQFLENYKRRLPKIWQYRERTIKGCENEGFVRTPFFGRIRYIKDAAFTQAVNTKIQSASADIMGMSLIKLHKRFKKIEAETGYYVRIIGTVHDSVLVECDEEIKDEITTLMKKIMENGPWKLDVPLEVDIKTGYSWGSML